ncbi:MAG TPA: CAP domain-containing protein [Jatrophihabitans sp.]|nr:CAP domain-containing protein [Jatrophihabitans sp.]
MARTNVIAADLRGRPGAGGRAMRPLRICRRLPVLVSILITTAVLAPAQSASATIPWHHQRLKEHRWAHAVYTLINKERSRHGLRPLNGRYTLHRSSRRHDYRMAKANELSHQLPGEADLATRIVYWGYKPWCYLGENIGSNNDISSDGVLHLEKRMYREKPPDDGHRRNILSKNYRHVGIDVWIDKFHGKVWLTEHFGKHHC